MRSSSRCYRPAKPGIFEAQPSFLQIVKSKPANAIKLHCRKRIVYESIATALSFRLYHTVLVRFVPDMRKGQNARGVGQKRQVPPICLGLMSRDRSTGQRCTPCLCGEIFIVTMCRMATTLKLKIPRPDLTLFSTANEKPAKYCRLPELYH
jgi:hypothetical protein